MKKQFSLIFGFSFLLMACAFSAAAQEAPAVNGGGMIEIGGGAEVSRQVSGPELGTVIGLEVFGQNKDESVTIRYFWVTGQVMIGENGSTPYVDVKIVPYAALSSEESANLRSRMSLQGRILPMSFRRDLDLDIDHSAKAFLGGITVGGNWTLVGKATTAMVNAFAELSVDALGIAFASQSEQGVDFFRVPILEAGVRAGFEARLKERVALRVTLLGADGYSVNASSHATLADGSKFKGYGLTLPELYSEISLGLRAAQTDFSLFVRGGSRSSTTTLTLRQQNQSGDYDVATQNYRYLRVGIRASFR